jgi:putative ABC transport system substrate-binding protein
VKRREFITLLGGAAAVWPLAARAQQLERMRRIGVLMVFSETDPSSQRRASALQTELAKLGWTLGRNLQIDYRWDISDDERATTAAAQLLALAPDVIYRDMPRPRAAYRFVEFDPEATIRPAGWLQNPRYARYGR